jgi:hypothetical protein
VGSITCDMFHKRVFECFLVLVVVLEVFLLLLEERDYK